MLQVFDLFEVYRNIRNAEVGKWTGCENDSMPRVGRLLRHLSKGMQLLSETIFPSRQKKMFRLGIVFKKTQKVIGMVTLTKNQSDLQCAEVGFWIGQKYWGHGLTTEALKLSMDFGFNQLNLQQIFAWTFEKNTGSKKVLEKCGFKLESVEEAVCIKYDEMQNKLNYRILKTEYKSN
jgi:RimJ/RimL family protein N-acetyltransferase